MRRCAMPKVKPYGNADQKAIAYAKRTANSLSGDETLVRRLNALKELTGRSSDAEFAELIGLSDGRYRYLKRHPSQLKLHEIRLIKELAAQYNFTIDFTEGING